MCQNNSTIKRFWKIFSVFFLAFIISNSVSSFKITSKYCCSNNIVYADTVSTDNIDFKIIQDEKKGTKEENDACDPKEFVDAIEKIEGASTFEKIIAKMIANVEGHILKAVCSFAEFSSLDKVIYNKGLYQDGYTPISQEDWSKMNSWYIAMIGLASAIMIIAIISVFIKFLRASVNVRMREEALNSLKRCFLCGILVSIIPYMVHILFFINNSLVYAFYTFMGNPNTSLDKTLGATSIISNLEIGSPLGAVIVLGFFVFLQIKINIIFIIRYFSIIVYFVLTPVVSVLWVIDENINGAKVWFGEMLSNIFMQTSYAFLFSIYITFMGKRGWVVQLIWATLIITLADVIRNMVQGKLTEMSGMNETKMAHNAILGSMGAIGAATGFIGQFKSNKNPISNKPSDPTQNNSFGEGKFVSQENGANIGPNNGGNNNGIKFSENGQGLKSVSNSLNSNSEANNVNSKPNKNSVFDTTDLDDIRDTSNTVGNKIGDFAGNVAKGITYTALAPMGAIGGRQGMNFANNVANATGSVTKKVASPIARGGANLAGTAYKAYSNSYVKNSNPFDSINPSMKDKVINQVESSVNGFKNMGSEIKNIGSAKGKGTEAFKNITGNMAKSVINKNAKKPKTSSNYKSNYESNTSIDGFKFK